MQAYDTEASIAQGRGALHDLFTFVVTNARELEAHQAEEEIFARLLIIGLTAMKAFFATKGTGDCGPAIERDDGVVLKREPSARPRDYFSVFGKFPVPRTCYRSPGEPGIFPLDVEANLPERCYSYYLQEWMNAFNVEHPFAEGSNLMQRFFSHRSSPTAMQKVARDSARDYDAFYEQKPAPVPETEGELLVVSFDGKGVPMIKEEAAKLKAKLGKGEKRQKKKEALVGVCYTVDPKLRTAEELAEQLLDPEAARQRRRKQDPPSPPPPKAQNVRRIASLERSKDEVMAAIEADATRRDPQQQRQLVVLLDGALGLWQLVMARFRGWRNATFILDVMHVVGYLWLAANALHGDGSAAAKEWVSKQLIQILRGRVGYVIGGMRQTIAKRRLQAANREAVQTAITYFTGHKRWMRYDRYLEAGMPVATGVVESACNSVVKHRMEGEGKRWSCAGAEGILLLRSTKKSGDFEEYSKFRATQEHARRFEYDQLYVPITTDKIAA